MTKELCNLFQSMKVQLLAGLSSDHKPILIELIERDEEKSKGYQGFKFESKWMLDEECNDIIKEAWGENRLEINPVAVVCTKLERCQGDLTRWSRHKFGNTEDTLKKKKKKIRRASMCGGA